MKKYQSLKTIFILIGALSLPLILTFCSFNYTLKKDPQRDLLAERVLEYLEACKDRNFHKAHEMRTPEYQKNHKPTDTELDLRKWFIIKIDNFNIEEISFSTDKKEAMVKVLLSKKLLTESMDLVLDDLEVMHWKNINGVWYLEPEETKEQYISGALR